MTVRAIAALIGLGLVAPVSPAHAQDGDRDGDLVPDGVEDRNGDGNPDNEDYDDDGTPDWRDPDDDGDGVYTADEDFDLDGDPTNDDLDEDGRPDYVDATVPLDVDGDGWISDDYGGDDCDDDRFAVHPEAYEPWYDGQDYDCLGNDDYDQDGDGYQNQYHYDGGGDCNDENPDVHPGVPEDLDPATDLDCDGFSDPAGQLVARGGCDCRTGAPSGAPVSAGPAALLLLLRLRRVR
jgi:hypothetical protein